MKKYSSFWQTAIHITFILSLVFSSLPAIAKESEHLVTYEVNQLITFITISECRFKRNGKWYEAVEAARHINTKYQNVQKKGLISSTEDFIKHAATKSSVSGKAYKVQCKDGEPQDSSLWLSAALNQLRKTRE